MIGRREFGLAGLSAVSAVALQSVFAQQARAQGPGHAEHDHHFEACARACGECQQACASCATHCARMLHSGSKEHITTLQTCQDCADFCAAAAHIVARGGPFAVLVCEGCVEACARCAKECERFPKDAHMKACAEQCRKCEKACREVIGHLKR